MRKLLVSVAVPVPLHQAFDYLAETTELQPGQRLRVAFGRRHLVGIVLCSPTLREAGDYDYKAVEAVLDETPLLNPELMTLCQWAAGYYQYPLGEVFAVALPGPLRRGEPALWRQPAVWQLTSAGIEALASLPARAHAQRALLQLLASGPRSREAVLETQPKAGPMLRKALAENWIVSALPSPSGRGAGVRAADDTTPADQPTPSPQQAEVLATLAELPGGFSVTLLEGVTGSGKTEIYLRLVAEALARGRQALVLVPEIGLTPQLLQRFRDRFGSDVAGFHSGLSEAQRAEVWLRAAAGLVRVIIGTRSAVFVSLARPGLIVIDEEHDVSYKQQEGLRYSARDVAIVRAQQAGVPVLLGSATPSLESLHNVAQRRYRHLRLTARISTAPAPQLTVVDMRGQRLQHGLSPLLLQAVGRHLADGGQVLLFINRRGYAPTLLCHDCGWVAPCRHCDARMTVHQKRGRLVCHHCGAQQAVPQACPTCASTQLLPVGQGTERIEDALREAFPDQRIERIDSDRARRAGELERLFDDVRSGAIRILVGTQMLAKGHDFAGLSLVGIVTADEALYSSDFRALERMGQLVTQVAGRAGRAERAGEVILQTHAPEHPMLRCLIEGGYRVMAEALLRQRRSAGLPPYAHIALLRAESREAQAAMRYLNQAKDALEAGSVQALGPVPATMERRAGRSRAQLLLLSASRAGLHRALKTWVPKLDALPDVRRVRWSLDVDPADLY